MTLLHLDGLGISLGEPLFSDLTLTLSKGDRLGLVAANGAGKSTLLSCLMQDIDPSEGEITRAGGLRIGYVPQYVPDGARGIFLYDFVLAALPPEQADYEAWRVDVVLGEMSVPYDLFQRPMADLSGGWQRMGLLARAWITEPDLLLIDEPTNHLDLYRIGQLQTWLAGLPKDLAIILTSHDRAFLDAVTNRTLFLRRDASRSFALPYNAANAALEEQDAADARKFDNDMRQAQNLRRQAAKLKNIGINSGSDLLLTKNKQLTARAEGLEDGARPAHRDQSAGRIRLEGQSSHAKALVTLDNLEVTTPDGKLLYRTGQKWICPGDRVVLLGANGAGKTQLVHMIAAALAGKASGVKSAASVVAGLSDQHLSQLRPTQTPMAFLQDVSDQGDQRLRSVLAGAGIAIKLQDQPISRLSGGQRARLAMLGLRLRHPNFYLLDEPTNHLDIEGQDMLEGELTRDQAACLLVSHDRTFLCNTGNRFWVISGRNLEEVDTPEPFLQAQLAGEIQV